MSTTSLIIEERSRDIGNFLVGRLLPFAKKRMVGPFIFVDHMGPVTIGPGRYMDVDQHPHIGLSTLTYLFEGEILHRDSIGSEQLITPGDVNWMTAGKGVVHTERTPVTRRDGKKYQSHGYQIWVALPKELEDTDPEFHHIPKSELPVWQQESLNFTLIAGKAFGKQSPVPVLSDLFMLKLNARKDSRLILDESLAGEIGFCVVEGVIETGENFIDQGKLLVSKTIENCEVRVAENTMLLLFGGKPFPEKHYIYWNFVSSNQNRIEKASRDWQNRNFPLVENDDTYVPLPMSYSKKFK